MDGILHARASRQDGWWIRETPNSVESCDWKGTDGLREGRKELWNKRKTCLTRRWCYYWIGCERMAFVPIIRCLHIRFSYSSCLSWKGFMNGICIPCAISDVFLNQCYVCYRRCRCWIRYGTWVSGISKRFICLEQEKCLLNGRHLLWGNGLLQD